MSIFKKHKHKWDFPSGWLAVNVIVALLSGLITTVLTIISLVKKL